MELDRGDETECASMCVMCVAKFHAAKEFMKICCIFFRAVFIFNSARKCTRAMGRAIER